MKNSEECIGSITFNITQDDVNAFSSIGASFYVTDQMDVVNGGKLYFIPPKNFSSTDDLAFMPSARAKHKAPTHDISIQEKPNKGNKVQKGGKKLPNRSS